METAQLIQRLKNGVTLRSPFYASLMLSLEFQADPSVETACVDGVTLRYNPEYVESLPFAQGMGLFAHETDHCARNHHTRMGNRELELFNIAADYSTNSELIKAGFELPTGCLIDPRFSGMSVERIYNILDQEREKKKQGGEQGQQGNQPGQGKPQPGKPDDGQPGKGPGDFGGCGSVVAPKNEQGQNLSDAELSKERVKWDAAVHLADSMARRIGNAPGSAKTIIRDMQDGMADWKDEMRRFLRRCIDQHYSWLSQDRRFIHAGWYIPNRESKRMPEMVIAIDTSGSVSARQLAIVKAELNHMLTEICPRLVHVVFCDANIQKTVTYEPNDYPVDISFPGRGGTRVRPVFDWVEQNNINPACMLYFSDLEISDWGAEPDYPVLWGALKKDKAPWGEVIDLTGI
jgi:predicted metal-dependent peptidase